MKYNEDPMTLPRIRECTACKAPVIESINYKFCPNCGSRILEDTEIFKLYRESETLRRENDERYRKAIEENNKLLKEQAKVKRNLSFADRFPRLPLYIAIGAVLLSLLGLVVGLT